jgi:hypothetical protein
MIHGDASEKDNLSSSLPPASIARFSDAACNYSSSSEKSEFWLVRMDKPGVEVVTKAQMVDHYTRILMKVVGKYVKFHWQPSYHFSVYVPCD